MSLNINKVVLAGCLGADPEVRYAQSGDAIATIRLATSETWKDKNSGEKREATEWHRVVFYRKLAEIVEKYLKKGSNIYIEGQIKTRKWQDKDGQDRYTVEIEADEMKMIDTRRPSGDNAGDNAGAPAQRQGAPAQNQQQRQQKPSSPPRAGNGLDEDIVF